MLRIDADHYIAGVQRERTENHSGPMREPPCLIVLHYTASGTAQSAINWFARKDGNASAHVIIDRSGNTVQMLPFDHVAWHAGKSEWQGRERCNLFSVGIELVNWGVLTKHNGDYKSYTYTVVPPEQVAECDGKYWQKFTPQQISMALCVTRSLCGHYPILDVAGHAEIARPVGRKIDPGPLLDMRQFRRLVK